MDEKKLEKTARAWGRHPEELREFIKMVRSGPWSFIQEVMDEIENGANGALLNGEAEVEIFRAQGRLSAITDLKSRIDTILTEVEDV